MKKISVDAESEKSALSASPPEPLPHDYWNIAEDVKIQEAIWYVEMGPGKRRLLWCALILLALAVGLLYANCQFRGLEHREAMEMAQLARNISRGQGFTTYVIRPLSLSLLEKHGMNKDPRFMNHPDLHSPPLYPLVLTAFFAPLPSWAFQYQVSDIIFLPERWIILPLNYLCFFASVLLMHFWARHLVIRWVAITAPLLLLFSDLLWGFAISGLPTNFLILLFLCSIYCLWRADQHWHAPEQPANAAPALVPTTPKSSNPQTGWWWVASGAVLFGLCFLTQYNTIFLLPAMLIYAGTVCGYRGAWRGGAFFAVIYTMIIVPWLFRNYIVSHSLLGVAKYDFLNGVLPSHYHPNLNPVFDITTMGCQFIPQFRHLLFEMPGLIGSEFLMAFFVVGLLYRFTNPTTARLRGVVWSGLACATLGLSFVPMNNDTGAGLRGQVQSGNLLVLFLPLATVYGVAFFYLLLDRIAFPAQQVRKGVITLFILLNVAPLLYTLSEGQRPTIHPYPPYCPPYTAWVGRSFAKDAIGSSDLPWAMAWIGDRRTVWLPTTPNDLTKIHETAEAQGGLSFLLLTPQLLNQRFQSEFAKGEYAAWQQVVEDRIAAESKLNKDEYSPRRQVVEDRIPAGCPFNIMRRIPPNRDQILYTVH